MSKEKRRWWRADARFLKVYRRLRLNYRKAAQVAELRADDRALRAISEQTKKFEAVERRYVEDLRRSEERAAAIAKEIARVRLEFGPRKIGTRFTLYASFDETFMMQARDLKEVGPYVVEMLTAMIRREFSQLDFERAKPIVPRTWEEAKRPPRWFLDSDDIDLGIRP